MFTIAVAEVVCSPSIAIAVMEVNGSKVCSADQMFACPTLMLATTLPVVGDTVRDPSELEIEFTILHAIQYSTPPSLPSFRLSDTLKT